MATAGGKLKFLQLEPATPIEVPNGSMFIDSTNSNAITYKNPSGTSSSLTNQTAETLLLKQMQSAGPIAAKAPLAKLSNGKVAQADSDADQSFIGFSMGAVSGADELFTALLVGANLEGAVSGLGFIPGQDVLLGENGDYVSSISGFTGGNDSIIKVGVADCAAGLASPIATDLIIFSDVIARP